MSLLWYCRKCHELQYTVDCSYVRKFRVAFASVRNRVWVYVRLYMHVVSTYLATCTSVHILIRDSVRKRTQHVQAYIYSYVIPYGSERNTEFSNATAIHCSNRWACTRWIIIYPRAVITYMKTRPNACLHVKFIRSWTDRLNMTR